LICINVMRHNREISINNNKLKMKICTRMINIQKRCSKSGSEVCLLNMINQHMMSFWGIDIKRHFIGMLNHWIRTMDFSKVKRRVRSSRITLLVKDILRIQAILRSRSIMQNVQIDHQRKWVLTIIPKF
jgi:hypothetical protein